MLELAASYRRRSSTIEQRQAALARSESDLEAQKEWLRVTLTSIGDGVIVTDPEGRVVLMNHEAERLTGWTLAEALHQPLAEIFKIINEDTRAAVDDPVAKVLVDKKDDRPRQSHRAAFAQRRRMAHRGQRRADLDAQGETLGVVLVFHDATSCASRKNRSRPHSRNWKRPWPSAP